MLRALVAPGLLVLFLMAFTSCTDPEDPIVPAPTATAVPAAAPSPTPRPAPPRIVFVVRHAEKASETEKDPLLSPAGRERAQVLAHVLAKSGVTAIYATHYQRTQLTAKPLADQLGLPIQTVEASEVDEMIRQVMANPGGVVVTIGHSDSVATITSALSGVQIQQLEKWDHDDLYVITFDAEGRPTLVSMQYGAQSRPED